jgi:glycosyltransferase involved in cell wall biosynthesis
LRILYFADIRFPLERANGIQTMETCHALARRGHDVTLVVRPDTQTPARDPFDYYGLPPMPRLIVERAPGAGPALAKRVGYLAFAFGRAAGTARADLVMTRDLAVAALLLRLPSRPPLVYESHGYAPDVAAALPTLVSTARPPGASKLARLARRESRVRSRADGYVTITRGLAESLATRFGARPRVAVIHDGVRLKPDATSADVASAFSRTDDRVIVGYAGHLYPWKGVDVLLEALARIPAVRATIVGGHEREPDLARLKTLTATLGLAERVTFTGLVAPHDVAAYLNGADILALPNPPSAISSHSTSPLKLFEYMAAGKAIVASHLPAIAEVLTDDVNALLVAPGDAGALAEGIRRLAADPALRARLGTSARRDVAEYSWDRRAERLEALFNDVVAARR